MNEIKKIQLNFDTSNMSESAILAAQIRKYMVDRNMIEVSGSEPPDSWKLIEDDTKTKKKLAELSAQNKILEMKINNLSHVLKNMNRTLMNLELKNDIVNQNELYKDEEMMSNMRLRNFIKNCCDSYADLWKNFKSKFKTEKHDKQKGYSDIECTTIKPIPNIPRPPKDVIETGKRNAKRFGEITVKK